MQILVTFQRTFQKAVTASDPLKKNYEYYWLRSLLLCKSSKFHAVPSTALWTKVTLQHFVLCWLVLIFHGRYVIPPCSQFLLIFSFKYLQFRAYSQGENRRTTPIWRVKKIKTQMKDIRFFQPRLRSRLYFIKWEKELQEGFPLLLWQVSISNLRVTAKFPV